MADILSMASLISFFLAFLTTVFAVVVYLALDVRGVRRELKGGVSQAFVVAKKRRKKRGAPESAPIGSERTTVIQDEAVTTLENGEIAFDPLVDFYEPGTELVEEVETDAVHETPTTVECPVNSRPNGHSRDRGVSAARRSDAAEEETTELSPQEGQFVLQCDIVLADQRNALYELISQ